MRLRLVAALTLLILGTLGASTPAWSEAPPGVAVTTDRYQYSVGETVTVSFDTRAGAPSDVYVILKTPSGRQLFADRTFHFRGWEVAAGRAVSLTDGRVDIPISLATSRLARPGEFTLEVFIAPPGADRRSGILAGEVSFLVSLPGLNYLAIHNPESPQYIDDCASCHIDKTRDVTLAPGVPSFHSLKYKMFGGDRVPRNCTYCHRGADLLASSQAALRKDVPPEFCNMCHSAAGPAVKLYASPSPRP